MKSLFRIAWMVPMVLTLTSCEYRKLEELRTAEPTGTPLQKALWSNYRDFSQSEEKDYDWSSAVIFASKALDSAYGQDVQPEQVGDWDIPEELQPQFVKAREDLMAALASDDKDVRPQLVADAQTNFDCWLEQQEEGWQTADIERCREGFYDAMQELKASAEPVMKPKAKAVKPKAAFMHEKSPQAGVETPKTVEAEAPKAPEVAPEAPKAAEVETPKAKESETASYIVFFQPDDVALDPSAQAIIDAAAQSVQGHESYRIIINAHTDNSDSAKLDPDMPAKRAAAIKDRLVENGVKESGVDILAKGEDKSAAKALFSRTPVARQVEIFITE